MSNATREEFQAAREATGPAPVSLWQMLRMPKTDPLARWQKIRAEHGDVAHYRVGLDDMFLVTSADGARRVLQENVSNYSKQHGSYGMLRLVVGNGLLTSEGSFWLRQRRLAQPAFHRQRIAQMADRMTAAADALAKSWHTRTGPIHMVHEMSQLTLRVVGEALFGTELSSEAAILSDAWKVLNGQLVERYNRKRLIPPILPTRYDRTFREARRTVAATVDRMIAFKRAALGTDLLSMLIAARDDETGEQMTDRQLRDEVLTMLLAGHETTSLALAWAWALIDQHPDVRVRLQRELTEVLGGRLPTADDFPRLVWTRAIIDEALRLYPTVYILFRRVLADDVVAGCRVRKGGVVVIAPMVLQRHPAYWPEPDAFRPERWLDADEEKRRPRFAFMPFSGGPRQCIGNAFAMMEAVLVLATLAQRFSPRLVDGYELRGEYLVTLRPAGGLPMELCAPRVDVAAGAPGLAEHI